MTDDIKKLTDDLIDAWVYYKNWSIKRMGGKEGTLSRERARALYGERLSQLAETLAKWDIAPKVAIAAMWGQALADKHLQGPYPNVIASPNYLRRALSRYIGVPIEVVVEKTSRRHITATIEEDYMSRLLDMKKHADANPLSFSMAVSTPACFRLMVLLYNPAVRRDDLGALAVDALAETDADARMAVWLESRGISFDKLAGLANLEDGTGPGMAARQALVDAIAAALALAKGGEDPDKVLEALKVAARLAKKK